MGSGSGISLGFTPSSGARTVRDHLFAELLGKLEPAESPQSEALVQYQKDPVAFGKDILGHEYPDRIKELFAAVIEHEIVIAQSCNGFGKCLGIGERLPLADGRFAPVESLVGQNVFVMAFDPVTGAQVPSLALIRENGTQPVYRVTTTGGRSVIRTGNHPLLTAKSEKKNPAHKCSSLIPRPTGFKPVEDLCVASDLIAVPQVLEIEGAVRYDEDKLKLAAYLLTDGGTTSRISFTEPDGLVKEEFVRIVESLGCDALPATSNKYEIRITSSNNRGHAGSNTVMNLTREWGLWGKKSTQKSFPDFVWQLPNDQLALFLNRIFSCDGYAWVTKADWNRRSGGRVAITFASETMVRDVEMALLRLGINGYFRHRKTSYTGCDKKFDAWEYMIVRQDQVLKFAEVIGIFGKEEQLEKACAAAREFTGHKEAKWPVRAIHPGYRWEKIRSLEYLGEMPTYNVAVPCQHTFITTVVEHNSFGAADMALFFARCFPKAEVYLTAAPPEKNLKRILWDKITGGIKANAEAFGACRTAGMTVYMESGSSIDGLTIPGHGDDHDREARFGGKHAPFLLFIVDEGDAVPDAVYTGIDSCMSGGMARLLVMFNPRHKHGRVYKMIKDHEAVVVQLSAFEHPNVVTGEDLYPGAVTREKVAWRINAWTRRLPPDDDYTGPDVFTLPEFMEGYVARKKDGTFYPPLRGGRYRIENPQFAYKVLGEYPVKDENVLIEETWIDNAVARWKAYVDDYGDTPPEGAECISGVDPGELGADKTSVCHRYGAFVKEFNGWGGVDMSVTNDRAEEECRSAGSKKVFVDANGVGAGVAPALRRVGLNAVGVKTQVRANEVCEDGEFDRMRDQLLWQIRLFLKNNTAAMLPDDEELREELPVLRFWDKNGRIKVTDKDSLRDILKRSPNKTDALALTFAPHKGYTGDAMTEARHRELKAKYCAPL